jgi:hypothetical protein
MSIEKNYSKRELDTHFEEIKEYLVRIENQTVRTNGRVNKLENWRSVLIGGWAIVTFLVIPLLTYIYLEHEAKTQAELKHLQEN